MGTKAEVKSFLATKLNEHSPRKDWYVGIASNVRIRLFGDHKVHEKNGRWAHSIADTNAIAREVEKELLDTACDGGGGGGDSSTKTVYVYLKTSTTDP